MTTCEYTVPIDMLSIIALFAESPNLKSDKKRPLFRSKKRRKKGKKKNLVDEILEES